MGTAHAAHAPQPPAGQPPRARDLAEANRLLAAQDREIRQLRAKVAALEAANARITRRKWWTEDLDRNGQHSGHWPILRGKLPRRRIIMPAWESRREHQDARARRRRRASRSARRR